MTQGRRNKLSLKLLVILALGFTLRVYALGHESLWMDEFFTLSYMEMSISEIVVTAIFQDANPPLYYILLNLWSGISGLSDFSVRMFSVVSSVGSMLFAYRIASYFGNNTGYFAALMVSVSHLHVFLAQQARSYSLFALVSTMSAYYFLELLDDFSSRKSMGLFVISTLATLYSHNYGVFVVLAEGFYVLTGILGSKKSFLGPAKGLAVSALLYIPWVPYVFAQTTRVADSDGFWIPTPKPGWIWRTFVRFVAGWRPLLGIGLMHVSTAAYLLLIASSVPFIARRLDGLREVSDRAPSRYSFLWVWLVFSTFVPLSISFLIYPIYIPRYALSASTAFFILSSIGLSSIRSTELRRMVLLLLVASGILWNSMYYSSTDMQDWEGAADHIAEEMEEDSVITYIEIKTPQVFSHYEPSENFSLHRLPMEGNNLAIDDANLTYLREFSDIWYIGWREEGNGRALNRSLNRSTYNSTEIDFHRISLYRFRRQ